MKFLLAIPAVCLMCFACNPNNTDNSHRNKSEEHSSDWEITTKVKSAITADDSISVTSRLVSVKTMDGVVTVSGTVSTKEDQDRIVKIVKNVHGVKNVNNKMTVEKICKKSSKDTTSDWSITTKVKAEIVADGSLSAGARVVSINTTGGVVTITGSVPTKEDKDRIVKIAKKVHGVKSVNDKMTISSK